MKLTERERASRLAWALHNDVYQFVAVIQRMASQVLQSTEKAALAADRLAADEARRLKRRRRPTTRKR